jgi:hypothetical protein
MKYILGITSGENQELEQSKLKDRMNVALKMTLCSLSNRRNF